MYCCSCAATLLQADSVALKATMSGATFDSDLRPKSQMAQPPSNFFTVWSRLLRKHSCKQKAHLIEGISGLRASQQAGHKEQCAKLPQEPPGLHCKHSLRIRKYTSSWRDQHTVVPCFTGSLEVLGRPDWIYWGRTQASMAEVKETSAGPCGSRCGSWCLSG